MVPRSQQEKVRFVRPAAPALDRKNCPILALAQIPEAQVAFINRHLRKSLLHSLLGSSEGAVAGRRRWLAPSL